VKHTKNEKETQGSVKSRENESKTEGLGGLGEYCGAKEDKVTSGKGAGKTTLGG